MIEHLLHNSCGERDALLAGLAALPFLGPWLAARLRRWRARGRK